MKSAKRTIKAMEAKQYKVARVTDSEFELDNGDIYQMPFQLDYTPSVEDFQEMLDQSKYLVIEFIKNADTR